MRATGLQNHLDLYCFICVWCEGLSLGAAPGHTEAGWVPDLWHGYGHGTPGCGRVGSPSGARLPARPGQTLGWGLSRRTGWSSRLPERKTGGWERGPQSSQHILPTGPTQLQNEQTLPPVNLTSLPHSTLRCRLVGCVVLLRTTQLLVLGSQDPHLSLAESSKAEW